MGIVYGSVNEFDAVFLKDKLDQFVDQKLAADLVSLQRKKMAVLLPGPQLQNISELLLQRQNSSGYQAKWIQSKYSYYIIELCYINAEIHNLFLY